jgi:hypothetical protein
MIGRKRPQHFQSLELFVVAISISLTTASASTEFKTERFRLMFGDDGTPTSLLAVPGGEEILNRSWRSAGFYLESADHKRTLLPHVERLADNRLTAQTADGKQAVVFITRSTDRYVSFRIEKFEGIPADRNTTLHLEMNSKAGARVTELDYMTRVQNESYGVRVHWDDIWHRAAGEPLGGFALFVRDDEADEDESLLRIWVGEKLAHPKVTGEWTLDRARAWLADWQRIFADRSQLILEGENLDELRAALPWAERARIKEIYLFTQTWRTDNFWPGDHGNIDVNRNVFPRGEDDLRSFSEELRAKNMRLNLHYVSGGIGRTDPKYVGAKPDRRLAGWARGVLAKAASSNDAELVFRPEAGAMYPPMLPHFFDHDHVRIENEIVRVGSFEIAADGTWTLKICRRGQFLTKASEHAAGADGQGLVVAFGQNYVPDNDSTLHDEIAVNYAQFLNRCGIPHTEYDGAEIHTYNGLWGYLKFATKVYENVDHPITAHDSSGNAPRCNFEYRFNSSQKILRGTCRFTHGNWSAPVELASPSRVASTPLDANFVLSQGHLGGAMGLCKPEPMFAVSDRSLKAHGLSDAIIETLLNWKAVAHLLTDEQRAKIDASFVKTTSKMPERSHHAASRFVQVARKMAKGFQIVPVCVMTRKTGDILWQQGQEHGAISPRQYMKPGDEISLENPFAAQPAKFIIHVLWDFDPRGPSEILNGKGNRPAPQAHPSDAFTAGNNGRSIAQTNVRPNLVLQPAIAKLRFSGAAALKQSFTNEDTSLRMTAENPDANEVWADVKKLPEWSAPMDMTGRRGIGMRVTGDGSGALLVFAISGRDYVVPIDFTGTREIEIPNGEVAWSSGAWGWRMDTKHADYAHQHACRIGFGHLPAKTKTSVRVEAITALAEIPAHLESPVIRTGSGTLSVNGYVASGEYLQFDGGDAATVFDDNWNKLRELHVVKKDYAMPYGFAPISIQADAKPWLEVQFMTEGEPMFVPAR